jgi:tetratricopeptide (TPR) repeat protein
VQNSAVLDKRRRNLQRDTASAQATIQELRKILENPNISNSTRGLFHFFAGQFDKRGGRNDEAADHYRIAVKYLTGQNERHHELLLSRLNFFHTQFDLLQWTALDKGLTCLEEEVFANQYTFLLAGVLNLKANLLVRQGRLAKALESLSTSESLVDEQDHYHRLLIRHKRVVALRHLGQWTEALAIIEASSQEARHVGQWGPWARIELERMRVLTYLGQSDAALDAGRTLLASKRLSAVEHHLVHNQMGVTEGFANGDVESALSHTVPVDDQEIHIEPWDVKHVPEVWNEDFSHFLDAGSSRRSSGLHEPWSSLAFARTHRTRPMSLPEKLKYSPLLEALCRRLDITVPDGVTPSPEWATKAIGSWEALLAATVPMVSDKAVTVVYPGGDRHELSAQVLDRLCHQHKGMVVDQVRDRIYVVGQEVVALKRPSVLKRVLYCLVKHRPRACSKETIIHEVWRRNYNPAVDDPLIYTTIRRLRSFLEQDLKHPRYIQHSDNSYLLNFKEGVLVVERAMTSAVRDPLEWAAKYCREHGKISRLELTRQFALSESTAKRMLSQWLAEKRVTQHGSGRGTHYTFVEATPAPTQST